MIRVKSCKLLPVRLCLVNDGLAHHVDSLVVLDKHIALISLMGRPHHDQLLRELLNLEILNCLGVTLATCLTDGIIFMAVALCSIWVGRTRSRLVMVLAQLAHVGTTGQVSWVTGQLDIDRLTIVGDAHKALFIGCLVVWLC